LLTLEVHEAANVFEREGIKALCWRRPKSCLGASS